MTPTGSKAGRQIASAQVIVRAASGKRFDGHTAITVDSLPDYAPSAEDAEAARAAFAAAGFDCGPLVGISFSITAERALFEQFFGATLRGSPKGGDRVVRGGAGGLELPLGSLPSALRERLVAVTFSPPADLHEGRGHTMR